MPRFASYEYLQRVGTSSSRDIGIWREGLNLESATSKSVDQLIHRATKDRLALAMDMRRRARRCERLQPPMYRDAISRYYYCLYHAFRAMVYFVTPGDDYQEHKQLPAAIPADFPQANQWRNDLKNARLIRNTADYNAYPKSDSAWRQDCLMVAALATDAIPAIRSYLLNRGCIL